MTTRDIATLAVDFVRQFDDVPADGAAYDFLRCAEQAGFPPDDALIAWDCAMRSRFSDDEDDYTTEVEEWQRLLDSFVDWNTFGVTTEAPTFLIAPLFVKGGVNVIYSEAGMGKSLLVQYAMAALASGKPFLGYDGGEPVSVLYIDQEMSDGLLLDRLEDAAYHVRYDDPERDPVLGAHFHYANMPPLPMLNTPEGGEAMRKLAEHFEAQVVVIDTTTDSVEGDENDNTPFKLLWRYCVRPLKERGCTVILLSHAGKDPDSGIRGGSAQQGNPETIWRLQGQRGSSVRKLLNQKKRVKWVPSSVEVQLVSDPHDYYVWKDRPDPRAVEVAGWLDAIDAPSFVSRDDAAGLLRDAGFSVKNDHVGPAIKFRQTQGR